VPDILYGAAEAREGWVCVAPMLYDGCIWEQFCELIDRPVLLAVSTYEDDDVQLVETVRVTGLFDEWLADQTVPEALEVLDERGIPAA
jgi:crotonobetainyl-CoA:carnitine CoA-transferase CaiB-like acyl-CoA transferase